ncbi:barstar family protein [Chromobacterium sphagni]|uniref:barstar family protein n=1 Tax=Chromobacterium sphagni TaxID=1903179 RepID=UPI001300D30E|nr:barstar family protein [Chromobacterium sphagni]
MKLFFDGAKVQTVSEFHCAFSKLLGIEDYYGKNFHALRDVLSTGVERPCHLVWENSEASKIGLGNDFNLIIQIFEEARRQDERYGWVDRFTYELK